MKSWKTTTTGILTIIAGLAACLIALLNKDFASISFDQIFAGLAILGISLPAGIGQILAKDHKDEPKAEETKPQ